MRTRTCLVLAIIMISASLLGEDEGLRLGETHYFTETGRFSINATEKENAVKVDWPDQNAHRYGIYRGEDPNGGFKKVGLVQGSSLAFTDQKIEKGKTYYYAVLAVIKVGGGGQDKAAGQQNKNQGGNSAKNKLKDKVKGQGRQDAPDAGEGEDDDGADTDQEPGEDKEVWEQVPSHMVSVFIPAPEPPKPTPGPEPVPEPVPVPEPEPELNEVNVQFSSTPPGATVIINNRNIGKTPVSRKYKLGSYQLTLQKSGYETYRDSSFQVYYKPDIRTNIVLEQIRANLNITTSPPGASVKVDGVSKGNAPVKLKGVPFGEYRVTAELPGYVSAEKVVAVDSGEAKSVNLVLRNETGGLKITTVPAGAAVRVDNIDRGASPVELSGLPVGTRLVAVERTGYSRLEKEVVVEAGAVKDLFFELRQDEGYLSVRTLPDSAECYIDDTLAGTTPVRSRPVPPGTHKLRVRKPNYNDYEEIVSIGVNEHLERDIVLSMEKAVLNAYSQPPGAGLYLNGQFYGYTPFISDNLAGGRYTLVLQKKGYHGLTNRVMLSPGKTTALNLKMKPIETVTVPPRPLKGSLSVLSQPAGAACYVNDIPQGSTPVVLELLPGSYTVRLQSFGYAEWVRTSVEIQAGKVQTLNPVLQRLEASLVINSVPSGASIVLDNRPAGTTPRTITVAPGTHAVNLSLKGYGPVSDSVSVPRAGETVTRDYTLKPAVMRYTFTSQPLGAEVFLNNRLLGITPFETTTLADGSYTAVFRKPGYRDETGTVDVAGGTPPVISARLQPHKGSLLVESSPGNAELWIGGDKIGRTGVPADDIPAGYHKVTVKLWGYYDLTTEVQIRDSEQTTIRVSLVEKPKGNIKILSAPAGASVYLNGQYRGQAPVTIKDYPEGRYSLKLKMKGYRFFYTTVSVIGHETTLVEAQLVKREGCCISGRLLGKPVIWYLGSAACAGFAGYSWYMEDRTSGAESRDWHNARNGFLGASGGALSVGIILQLAK